MQACDDSLWVFTITEVSLKVGTHYARLICTQNIEQLTHASHRQWSIVIRREFFNKFTIGVQALRKFIKTKQSLGLIVVSIRE
ncbi:hypothetical protein D3C72_1738230 [compost metagenome]